MDNLENDKPFSNGNYNNNVGEEINSVPSNEKGDEINDAVRISLKSKKIAKAITSTVVIFAIIALFAPIFARACSRLKGTDYAKLFACELSESVVSSNALELDFKFSRLDEKTQKPIEGDINLQDYGEDAIVFLSGAGEKYEKIITSEINANAYHLSFQSLKADSEYELSIKIGENIIFEKTFKTLTQN